MENNYYADWMLKPLNELDMRVDLDYVASISDKLNVSVSMRIQNVGGVNGMLLFDSGSPSNRPSDMSVLSKAGYGYSSMQVPRDGEIISTEGMKELLIDWGWSGDKSDRPEWFDEPDPLVE